MLTRIELYMLYSIWFSVLDVEVLKGKVCTIIIKREQVHDFYIIQRIIKSYVYVCSPYLNAYNVLV